jgi:predicted dehydrogenase/nucleoside-diphosphate-sugar epimerase
MTDLTRVAVVGCGAIAQQFHIPILAGHEGVRLVALVDRDLERARALATHYSIDRAQADTAGLDTSCVDAVLIATPPSHHASCAIELAQRKIHLFVEKPMAIGYDEAKAMVQAAEGADVILAVDFFRRLFPRTALLRALIETRLLGHPIGFDIEDGGIYGWPAATLGNMRRGTAGGGALIDVGSHAFDQILFILQGRGEVLEYRDNALGGIESDCVVRLRISHDGGQIDGRVELSRTRTLRNTIQIEFERGVLEVGPSERSKVRVRLHDLKLADPVTQLFQDYKLDIAWADEPDPRFHDAFRVAIDDWLEGVRTGRPPKLAGASALPTVKLVEECYRRAQPLNEPGISEALDRRHASPGSRRVLITGATGFIGGRVAEILCLRDGWDVRAIVRNPARVSRLARLPVELIRGDIESSRDVARALEGCDAVVHCAMGTSWRDRAKIFSVNVDGTRNVATASLAAGVRRFVHLSSIAVHGPDVSGIIDESTPVRPTKGDVYSESKAAAERVVLRAVREGLGAVILRPAHVYGPFSPLFASRLFRSLVRGELVFGESADTLSNTVYVDNVVEAIAHSLAAGDEARGATLPLSDADGFTWRDFYAFFSDAIGVVLRDGATDAGDDDATPQRAGVRSWYRGFVEIARSSELRALARRVVATDPIGRLPRKILDWSRPLRSLSVSRPDVYRRAGSDGEEVIEFRLRYPRVSDEGARRVLGYAPVVPRTRAMQLTLDWLRYARLLG